MSKFVRSWSPEATADIIERHIRGESFSAIAREHGCSHTTVSRLLKAPDIQTIISEQRAAAAAAEQETIRRQKKSERDKRHYAREHGYATSPEDLQRKKLTGSPSPGPTIAQQRARKDRADGVLLGLFSFRSDGSDARWTPNRAVRGHPTAEATEQELDALEKKLQVNNLSSVVVDAHTSRSFDSLDVSDVSRTADWLSDFRPDLHINNLKATLASVTPGSRFILPPPRTT